MSRPDISIVARTFRQGQDLDPFTKQRLRHVQQWSVSPMYTGHVKEIEEYYAGNLMATQLAMQALDVDPGTQYHKHIVNAYGPLVELDRFQFDSGMVLAAASFNIAHIVEALSRREGLTKRMQELHLTVKAYLEDMATNAEMHNRKDYAELSRRRIACLDEIWRASDPQERILDEDPETYHRRRLQRV